jgi:hypothetical protein
MGRQNYRPKTPEQLCKLAMSQHEFSYTRRVEWNIWAAKASECPSCGAKPYDPCLNLTERGQGNIVRTKWPHANRVDWQRFLDGLKSRGLVK